MNNITATLIHYGYLNKRGAGRLLAGADRNQRGTESGVCGRIFAECDVKKERVAGAQLGIRVARAQLGIAHS